VVALGGRASEGATELDHGSPRLVDHDEAAVEPLGARLPVVEGLDHRETVRVDRQPRAVDVRPAALVPGPGDALVEDVQVAEPDAVQQPPAHVDVRREPVALHDGVPVPVVAGVPPSLRIGRSPVEVHVVVATVSAAHGAAPFLEVAAPRVALSIQVGAVGQDVAPAFTPALWLAGIALVGDRLFITRIQYRRWMYGVLVAAFLLFHNLHAALVLARGQ
jgi:hypothetical protein